MNGGFAVTTHGNLAVVGSTVTRDSLAVAGFPITRDILVVALFTINRDLRAVAGFPVRGRPQMLVERLLAASTIVSSIVRCGPPPNHPSITARKAIGHRQRQH